MDRYEVGGLVFDVTDAGPADGEVIILLHGFPETRASWDGVIPILTTAGYRVLAPDQRGYSPGARPKGRKAYRMEVLVDDVLALADRAESDKFHVVGHDWGGAVAWALAGWHPERLYSMTSLTTPHPRAMQRAFVSSRQGLRSWYMLYFQLPRLPEMALAGRAQPLMKRSLMRAGLSEDAVDRYLANFTDRKAATAALNWYRAIPFLPPSRMVPVSVPTLYVYGTNDVALGRKAADLTGQYVKGPYRYEVLDGVSHWIPEEVPDVVGRLVVEEATAYGARTA
jgi:pimeloyl-ACP methyl ester carboxylesterase